MKKSKINTLKVVFNIVFFFIKLFITHQSKNEQTKQRHVAKLYL